ncbi:GGDEF domain-containing protein [Lysinibacillus sp. KU-BSD001]|uniref:diguanylate cyclase domain-containing protein n=1 Tax=Lysinibacillus sp. KU-BSD001 TaxID=3141328 RepID=UPI0036E10C07
MQTSLTYEVRESIVRLNLRRMQIIATLVFYTLMLVTGIHFSHMYFFDVEKKNPLAFASLYTILFYVNMSVFYVNHKKRLNVNPQTIRKYERYIQVYVYSMLVLITLITMGDVLFYKHMAIFEVFYLLIAALLILKMHQFVVPAAFATVVFVIASFMNSTNEQAMSILTSVLIVVPTGMFIQWMVYRTQLTSIKQQLLLQKETSKTRELTKQLQEKNKELARIASHDVLTKLPNRRALDLKASRLLQGGEEAVPVTILLMDIDYFKQYNDYYGHFIGDEALVKVAATLEGFAKKYGYFVGRWGGEEFVMIADGHLPHVATICEELLTQIQQLNISHPCSECAKYMTMSIGVCEAKVRTIKNVQSCYTVADEALYKSKSKGRNTYTVQSLMSI